MALWLPRCIEGSRALTPHHTPYPSVMRLYSTRALRAPSTTTACTRRCSPSARWWWMAHGACCMTYAHHASVHPPILALCPTVYAASPACVPTTRPSSTCSRAARGTAAARACLRHTSHAHRSAPTLPARPLRRAAPHSAAAYVATGNHGTLRNRFSVRTEVHSPARICTYLRQARWCVAESVTERVAPVVVALPIRCLSHSCLAPQRPKPQPTTRPAASAGSALPHGAATHGVHMRRCSHPPATIARRYSGAGPEHHLVSSRPTFAGACSGGR